MKSTILTLGVLVMAATLAAAAPLDEARALVDAGSFDAAIPKLEAATRNPAEAPEAYRLLTRIANNREDYEQGTSWGKKAIGAAPSNSDAHFQYAVAMRIKMQKVSKIKAMMVIGDYKRELARAIELDPRNVQALEEQIGFLSNAPGIAGGDVDQARERAEQLQKIDARKGALALARVETAAKKPERATEIYREALARHPDDNEMRWALASNLLAEEKWQEADAQFELVIAASDPRLSGPALYQRGRLRVVGNFELDRAVTFLQEYLAGAAVDARPTPSNAWWRIGKAYEQQGSVAEARKAYGEALRLDEGNDEAKKALKGLPRG